MRSEHRSYDRADEHDLVAWAQAGDQRAFAALVSAHRVMLYTVCFRIAGSRHDAEDAAQAALLAAWRHLDRFQGRSSFSTWLYRIGSNAALGLVRKRVPEPVADEGLSLEATAPRPDDTVADTDAVRRALERLPPEFRTALVLREFAGMSYREIADAMDIRVETVKTRISRRDKRSPRLLEGQRVSELSFGRDGFVDMDAFPSVDPDTALAPDVYERLHDALVAEPVRAPDESQWDAMVDTALHEPGSMETEWLVPAQPADDVADDVLLTGDAAGPDDNTDSTDDEVLGDLDWPDHTAADAYDEHDPFDSDDADAPDEVGDDGDAWS